MPIDQQIALYLPLIEDFVNGRINAPQFQMLYLQFFKTGKEIVDREVFEVTNWLFGDADYYVEEDRLRDPEDLNDEQLLECAITARDKLLRIAQSHKESS